MRRSILFLGLVSALFAFAVSCSRESPAIQAHEMTGSREERVATMADFLGKRVKVPGEIRDVWYVEERIGDGFLGPSDYRAFLVLQVRGEDVRGWERLLKPLAQAAGYTAPETPRSWWVSQEEFQRLHLFEPAPLARSTHGWAAVAPDSGRIYVFSYSM